MFNHFERPEFTHDDAVKEGFSATPFETPTECTMVGHWEGNHLVIEYIVAGSHEDEREDDGYWSEGLWADSCTGTSEADLAVSAWAGYDQAHRVRPSRFYSEFVPTADAD